MTREIKFRGWKNNNYIDKTPNHLIIKEFKYKYTN